MTKPSKHIPEWIRKDDELGLTRIGLSWHERQPGFSKFLTMLATMAAFATLVCLAGAMLGWAMGWLYFLLWLAGAVGLFWWAVVEGSPSIPRMLVFERGGRMFVPYGIPRLLSRLELDGGHDAIVSIESRKVPRHGDPRDDYYCVRMIGKWGDVIVVSDDLNEQEAMKIAVCLSTALEMLRRATIEIEARYAHINLDDPETYLHLNEPEAHLQS